MDENDSPPKNNYSAYYWLNNDMLVQNGLFQIHFNHTDSSGTFVYKEKKHYNGNRKYIGDVEPIAKGITAFLINTDGDYVADVIGKIEKCEDISKSHLNPIYKKYYELQYEKAEKMGRTFSFNFNELDYRDFSDVFIPAHIEEERTFLVEPCTFYSDEFTHVKTEIKVAMRKYAEQYIKFVGDIQDAKYLPRGLHGCLDDIQLEKLYTSLTKGKFIKAQQHDFFAALNPDPLPIKFIPIKWIAKNQLGKPNQYKLRAFLETCGIVIDGKSTKKIDVSRCFNDDKGRPINLGNPKIDEYYKFDLKIFRKMLE